MKYQATFSNGQTITRTSERNYRKAGAYINVQTGELRGQTFSEGIPTETRRVFRTIPRFGISYKTEQAIKAYNKEAAKVWRWEVVEVTTE